MERAIGQHAAGALLDVASVAGMVGAVRIPMQYQRVDMARNNIVKVFLANTKADEDVVIMLDNDHTHPSDIIPRLVKHVDWAHEVVAAAAFRRSKPHDPCFYRGVYTDGRDGSTEVPTHFSGKLERVDITGTGAIAIRRSVFTKLDKAGHPWPYFRFSYKDGLENALQRTEDWQFGLDCMDAGVGHWVDTGLVTPHITEHLITERNWFDTLEEAVKDPEAFAKKYEALGMTVSAKEEDGER